MILHQGRMYHNNRMRLPKFFVSSAILYLTHHVKENGGLERKMKKWLLILGVLFCFYLTGCKNSILYNADLDKATVEAYVPVLETVPSDSLIQIEHQFSEEKYQISGKDAFYILPSHRPAPENILDFQVLDLIDGKISIYAYQAVCSASDQTGLGGAPQSGIAMDTENSTGERSDGSLGKMATILMSYNIDTREYCIFFHKVSDIEKVAAPDMDEEGIHGPLSSEKKDETGSFFVQKTGQNGNAYFIYLDGVGSIYDQTGRLIYTKDINSQLNYNKWLYGGDDAVITIHNVLVDKNYFMYVTLNIEKKETEITEDTSEEDLSKEENNVVQMVFSCFDMNIGEPENPTQEEKSYFISNNQTYETQKEEWMKADQQTFDLGVLEQEPSMQEIYDHAVPSLSQIKEIYPTTYETYHYFDPMFDLKLYYYNPIIGSFPFLYYYDYIHRNDYASMVPCTPSNMTAEEINKFSFIWKYRVYSGYMPVTSPDDGKGKVYFLPDRTEPDPQQLIQEKAVRTYRVTWREEEIQTSETAESQESQEEDLEESGSVVTYIEKSMEIKETETFDIRYELRFSGDVMLQWSEERYTSNMIAPSPGSGILYYYSKDTETDHPVSRLLWEQSRFSYYTKEFSGTAQNVYLFFPKQMEPIITVTTSKGIEILHGFSTYSNGTWQAGMKEGTEYFLPNYNLDYGLTLGDNGIDQLNELKISSEDEPIPVSNDGNVDLYGSTSFVFQWETGDSDRNLIVYMGGIGSGLIRYNLSVPNGSAGASGQVSSYPYYSIFQKDEQSLYGIGFQSLDYAYDQRDLPCAKLYEIPLKDAKAAANLTVSTLSKDTSLRNDILNGSDLKWNEMLTHLGIKHADLSQVTLYYGFLTEGSKRQKNAILDLYELGEVPAYKRTKERTDQILACLDIYSLENLLYQLRDDLYETNQDMTEVSIKTAVLQTLRENSGLTNQEWTKKLYQILFDLNSPRTLSEYKKQNAIRTFAEMAGIPLETNLESKIRDCKTEEELEQKMAEYYLDFKTVEILRENTMTTKEEKEKVEQALLLRQKTIAALKEEYFKTNKGMTETVWNTQLSEILSAFYEEE